MALKLGAMVGILGCVWLAFAVGAWLSQGGVLVAISERDGMERLIIVRCQAMDVAAFM